MVKEGAPQSNSQDSIWDNSLTWVQIRYRDNRGKHGYVEPARSPFPREYTDQELSDWLAQMNEDFNETAIHETLDKL